MSTLARKWALVTGASRGVGASVAQQLAARGADIIINYRNKGTRAEEVAAAVRHVGRHAILAQADMTSHSDVQTMLQQVQSKAGRIDLLVLNASGGLEKDKPADYAMQLNLTAQSNLVDAALPLMPQDSRIIFVTSHLAHFYGRKPVYAAYETVAASKRAGEDALRKRVPELAAQGISLIVVSGDMIEGTITPKLMARSQPGLIETRREQAGTLPTVDEFAAAIVDAAYNPRLQSGDVVFVGTIS
jgi:NAD(P)-dependent dehydrogenase (short-subunit alcohol dehydrogenase family)